MQQVPVNRRKYNKLVANELLEDFALRFTAKRARKWSSGWIANTALGIVSFLVLEALGGSITLSYGTINALWAIAAVSGVVIFSGIPICYYAAKYGVDIDLLSRGAGFGYIGSTIVSLIYASFTFIFFALEAAIMSMAIQLLFGIPLFLGYIISAVVVIPVVIMGITNISRFQMVSQPLWLALQLIPLYFVFSHPDAQLDSWLSYAGVTGDKQEFNWLLFGGASAVLLSIVAQIGEQVDILRFLPEQKECGRTKWWLSMLFGGPGWMLFGAAKLALGSFLAWLVISHGFSPAEAGDPAHMYLQVFRYMLSDTQLALIVASVFVIISQLKINVANAYAGSLAWSNFFSRLTHSHPGRVVWMVFNVIIALLLMELGVYQLLEKTLQVYSVLVLAWIGTLVADLIINKPLGLSPKGIEFKRSQLFDVNPVGLGSMVIASAVGLAAHLDVFNEFVKAFASYIAFALPFITAPIIALLTRSRFYLVQPNHEIPVHLHGEIQCDICEHSFEHEDMAFCPAYGGHICSLCCSLDVRCQDKCRKKGTLAQQIRSLLRPIVPKRMLGLLDSPISHFLLVLLLVSSFMGAIFLIAYSQIPDLAPEHLSSMTSGLVRAFIMLLIPVGIISGLFVLAHNSSKAAIKELQAHAQLLSQEITAHEITSQKLEKAKQQAETANNAKSRYLAGLSHELRTPLNVLLGYAQLLSHDEEIPPKKREYAQILRRNGKHLSDLLEGLLEISKIEAGRLELQREQIDLHGLLNELAEMFRLQANQKGLGFEFTYNPSLPVHIAADKQRLRQILINLLNNAVKYTEAGTVSFNVSYRNQVASFEISDTGDGLTQKDIEQIFKPFERIENDNSKIISGTGLGLTISNALASLMGGEISCSSTPGKGSTFTLKLMLSAIDTPSLKQPLQSKNIVGYHGDRQTILVVDDIEDQRMLVKNILSPLGFNLLLAESAEAALKLAASEKIHLFILDITMPETSGWQLAIQLRKHNIRSPIMMLSANIHELEKSNMLAQYHNDYLSKPVSRKELLAKLTNLLPIEWTYQNTATSEHERTSHNLIIPAKEELKKLRELAEIGFMTAFNEKMEALMHSGNASKSFFAPLQSSLQQCHFEKIVNYLDAQIDEHY
ncbi:hybrid sensor histidine kinase/response regulator [Reinekea marinisedimentorum]|uniref:histidine kinase n=1 Tax=Reinekea marinisedimentorum TaxID=230495 RepID=A0A4R3I009_9GAMM|nr:ATP-binding protein [Reinekea marinisedimentorum]TCS39007.1 signal transduction histidine kinase [Reinekea marinisedimentorum]